MENKVSQRTQKDVDALAKNIEFATTYEKCEELMEACTEIPPESDDFTPYDKMLWLVRWAFIFGYRNGLHAEEHIEALKAEQEERLFYLAMSLIGDAMRGPAAREILEKYQGKLSFFQNCNLETELTELGNTPMKAYMAAIIVDSNQ
jgi:hypothetical protein